MHMRKILLIGALLSVLIGVFTLSSGALTQITPGIPEFEFNIDNEKNGRASYTFGAVDAWVYYNIEKGNLANADIVHGNFWAGGSDAKAAEIRVKVWATNWLTGEKVYEESSSSVASSEEYAFTTLDVKCDLWYGVNRTYHEGTAVHQNGSRSVMWVNGYTD